MNYYQCVYYIDALPAVMRNATKYVFKSEIDYPDDTIVAVPSSKDGIKFVTICNKINIEDINFPLHLIKEINPNYIIVKTDGIERPAITNVDTNTSDIYLTEAL